MKLWKDQPDDNSEIRQKITNFTVGNDFLLDNILLPFDIEGSKAHIVALEGAGIITHAEMNKLYKGLDEIFDLWLKGEFSVSPEQEDMHTAIEIWLTKKYGELGKKIHAGRSRNDQVLTAMRLFEVASLHKTQEMLIQLAQKLLEFTMEYEKVPMPGYTHTRKAMLSSVGQWSAGYLELLLIQGDQFENFTSLVSRSPLGTAAGFGSTIDLNREATSSLLQFESVLISATSAQLSRGWMEWQLVTWLTAISSVTARMSADIIRYSSEAYGFFELDEVVSTGSSIMPQKKNPDVAELIRGHHSVMLGELTKLQALTQNLESGYHRDLQLSKEPVIKSFETIYSILELSTLLIERVKPDEAKLKAACTNELFAAEYANSLVVEKGISFREAYQKVKNNPDSLKGLTAEKMMKKYKQLGSPGNVGVQEFTDWLFLLKLILEGDEKDDFDDDDFEFDEDWLK